MNLATMTVGRLIDEFESGCGLISKSICDCANIHWFVKISTLPFSASRIEYPNTKGGAKSIGTHACYTEGRAESFFKRKMEEPRPFRRKN